nr:hypothetical protein B14D6.200 [imported] - Neurospora crassa [Neurospora crassa]
MTRSGATGAGTAKLPTYLGHECTPLGLTKAMIGSFNGDEWFVFCTLTAGSETVTMHSESIGVGKRKGRRWLLGVEGEREGATLLKEKDGKTTDVVCYKPLFNKRIRTRDFLTTLSFEYI